MDFKKWCEIHCIQILLLFCTFRIVLSDRQCSQGLETPGYTVPHGDIVIEYGGTLNITCIVVNDTDKNTSLSFVRNSVKLPSELIKVINSTAIQLVIKDPDKASGDTYTCEKGKTMVCMNHVTIGTKPQPVTDFNCIGYNFENLTCTWTAPENYVATNYNLSFTLGYRPARYDIRCPEIKKSDTSNKMSCFWNVSTTPPYRQVHKFYNFTLKMSNIFGTNNLTNKIFNHFAHVLPGPPENLTALSTTPSSIELYWVVPFTMQSFPPGVHHRILYQCEGGDKTWHFGGLITESQYNKEATFNLTNLKRAHTLCDIRVSLRSAEAFPGDEFMWSKNASDTVRTSSKIPDAPPETNVGSFEYVAFGNSLQNREAYIYWKQIPEDQKNGPDFRYNISVEGDSSKRPIEITNIYAKFKDLSIYRNYTFHIWSQNANGTSTRRSTIYVPRQLDRIKEPQSFTKVEYKDGEYELTWQPPELSPGQNITNYTIFFCQNDRDRPYQCNGMLDWTIVPSNATSKVMSVEKKKVFQFAISANTMNSSSGMLWAACTVIHNKNMGKMKTVWIHDSKSTFIEVRWKLDCSDRIGSVVGFIVYYCPIKSPLHLECKAAQQNVTFKGSNIEGGNVTNLNPYTTYMLTVSAITKNNSYSQQSDPLYNTTREAAPTPPRHVRVSNVTNSSISLAWDMPEAMNGVLRDYKIKYWENYSEKINTTKDLNITINNLVSFNRYTIKVSVCTIECSEEVTINQYTQRGYPSKIKKPTVDRRNDTSITIVWDAPSEPGDVTDHYTVRFKQRHKNENKTIERNTKDRVFVINNCGDGGKFNTFYISVKAVNVIDNKEYNGTWSDEIQNYCDAPVNYLLYLSLIGAVCAMVFVGFMIIRLYHRCKIMRNVEVKLPPGLEPAVADHTLVPWSTEKHQESRASYSPPDEELLLVKMSEGRHCSGDSSGCSSGHESVTSSLESGTHISSSSDSGTEQPGNYCALGIDPKIDSSYIPVSTPDLSKSPYKTCDVSSESSPYVMTGEQPVKTINPGYIPFNQAEPIGKSTGYVVAGIKNCNGYIPFNQTDAVNRNTGYVVAGIKNCKLD